MKILIIVIILVCVASFIVLRKEETHTINPVQSGTYIELTSKAGNKLVCPDFWTSGDSGSNWSLGDEQAGINIYTVIAEGSGSLEDFQKMVIDNIDALANCEPTEWTDIANNNWSGKYCCYTPKKDTGEDVWQFLIVSTGKYYHAMMIQMPELVYTLNKGTYKNIAMSFTGIE